MTQFSLFKETASEEKLKSKKGECLESLKLLYPKTEVTILEKAIVFAGFPMYRDIKFRDAFYSRAKHYIKNLHNRDKRKEEIGPVFTKPMTPKEAIRLKPKKTKFKIKLK